MKQAVSMLLCVICLGGCTGTTALSTAPLITMPGTAVPSAQILTATHPRTPSPTDSPVPAESPDPSLVSEEDLTQRFWVYDASEPAAGRSDLTTVTDGKFVYYRNDAEVDDSEWDLYGDYYYYSRVYRFDTKTKKSKLLFNTKGKGAIDSFYLSDNGTLYYSLCNLESYQYQLYCFKNGRCELILKDFYDIIRIDNNTIDYTLEFGSYPDEYYKYYMYEIDTAITSELNIQCPHSRYQLSYSTEEHKTELSVFDSETNKEFNIKINPYIGFINPVFVYNNILYVINYDTEKSTSTLYRIDIQNQTILSQIQLKGEIDNGAFYNSKWYFYIAEEDLEEAVVNERIYVYNLKTCKYSLLTKINVKDGNHLTDACLGAAKGYLWVYCRSCGDGLIIELKKRINIK